MSEAGSALDMRLIYRPFLPRSLSGSSALTVMAKRVVDVLVPVALDQAYSYRVPEGLELAPGDLVTVPLGARMATGVAWADNSKSNPRLDNRMRDIEEKLETLVLPPEPVARAPDPDFSLPDFTPAQRGAADALCETVASGGYGVTLLDGVTAAGKTRVYFEAIAEVIRGGKQALVLVPEIALTTQFLDRFAERFGVRPAEWHSQLSQRLRARTWNAVATGSVSVIIGARSALFLPYADLGLIVVDEEHDPAYKQEDGARYHARDMAVVRARGAHIPVVLVSATPSLETGVNARHGPNWRGHP